MLRVRFKVFHEDPRPIVWPIPHPYWITGYDSNDAAYLIAYADSEEQIRDLWPDAIDLDSTEVDCYEFSERFPAPEWIVDQIQEKKRGEAMSKKLDLETPLRKDPRWNQEPEEYKRKTLDTEIKVLDSGYIKLIECWGSDARIIESARMSTNKGFLGWNPEYYYFCHECGYSTVKEVRIDQDWCNCRGIEGNLIPLVYDVEKSHNGDTKLLSYLWNHKHYTPFEMAGCTIEVQAPIFVFREWHRHRTQSYNEMSARYTPLPDVNYTPNMQRLFNFDQKNKQAVGTGNTLTVDLADAWLLQLSELYSHAQRVYEHGLDYGVPKELARLCVPVARYSKMRASANLRNWLGFLTLRMDSNAQWEIRQYAEGLHKILSENFPRTVSLFDQSRGV